MARLGSTVLVLFVLTAVWLGTSCGDGDDATREMLRGIASRPEDITMEQGLYIIQEEQFVTDDNFSELSGGLIAAALTASDVEPRMVYERVVEGYLGKPVRRKGHPGLIYNGVILFSSPQEAKAFFEQSVSIGKGMDWLETNPGLLEDESLNDKLVQDVPIPVVEESWRPPALSDAIEQAILLDASGFTQEGGTLEDYILLLRHGPLWAMVRDPHFVRDYTVRGLLLLKFEALIAETIAARMVEAQTEA